jgi:hypothetical protein
VCASAVNTTPGVSPPPGQYRRTTFTGAHGDRGLVRLEELAERGGQGPRPAFRIVVHAYD